jgi:hypothetical protein
MDTYLLWHQLSLVQQLNCVCNKLVETPPEKIPEESKFLLEINFGKLTLSHIKNQQYWIIALQAAITAGQRSAAAGGQAKQVRHKVNLKLPTGPSLASRQ